MACSRAGWWVPYLPPDPVHPVWLDADETTVMVETGRVHMDTKAQEQEQAPDPIEVLSKRGLRREHIVVRDGKPFVLYAGLLDLAHRVGLVGITTTLLQAPASPGWTAIIHARASKLVPADGDLPERIECFDGIGDANEANTNRGISVHMIRLAETRAKARALRDLTNIGITALEELGGDQVVVRSIPIKVVAGPAAAQWEQESVDQPTEPTPDEQFEALRAKTIQRMEARPVRAPEEFTVADGGGPVTPKQKWLILKLLNEQGLTVDAKSWATKEGAKALIDTLLKGPKA